MEILVWTFAIGSLVLGGVFYAFSSFVMTALGNLKPAEGIRAMQQININVLCQSFLLLFLGLPLMALVLAFVAWQSDSVDHSVRLLAAAGIHGFGAFLVTMLGNVPLNERLARIDSDGPEAELLWRHYLHRWTQWNHLRTLACVAAGALLL